MGFTGLVVRCLRLLGVTALAASLTACEERKRSFFDAPGTVAAVVADLHRRIGSPERIYAIVVDPYRVALVVPKQSVEGFRLLERSRTLSNSGFDENDTEDQVRWTSAPMFPGDIEPKLFKWSDVDLAEVENLGLAAVDRAQLHRTDWINLHLGRTEPEPPDLKTPVLQWSITVEGEGECARFNANMKGAITAADVRGTKRACSPSAQRREDPRQDPEQTSAASQDRAEPRASQ